MIDSIKMDEIQGSSKLYIDYLYNFKKLKGYYASDYRSLTEREPLAIKEKDNGLLPQAIDILIEQNGKWLDLPAMKKSTQRLKQKGASVVITGQQLGLLGGPLYTIYKALTAVKLANMLNNKLNNPVVPIFWLEGEDHDLNEANNICLLDLKNRPLKLRLRGLSVKNRVPVGELLIGDGIKDLLQRIEQTNPESEFKPSFIQLIKQSYTPSSSWRSAFSRLIVKLLGKFGLLLLDPSDKRLKELSHSIFEKAIIYRKDIDQILQGNNGQLTKNGYSLQVKYNPSSTNLFLKVKGVKYLLETNSKSSFHLKGGKGNFSLNELLKLVKEQPERFIPNVLLRPLVQDHLLPTLAYVAGPSEISYFAQIKPLYDFFGVKMPFIFPRSSITLVERKIKKVAKKFNVDLADFFKNPEVETERVMNKDGGIPFKESFTQAQKELNSIIKKLRKVTESLDPTLSLSLEKAAMKMRYQLQSLEKKAFEANKRIHQTKFNQMEKLKNNLLPLGNLQERCLNIFPFLIRYGLGLCDRIYDTIELNNYEHKFIYL